MVAEAALLRTITKSLTTLQWIAELNTSASKADRAIKNLKETQLRERILADALVTYIAALFDSRRGTYSLINSYKQTLFIRDFKKMTIVKRMLKYRHNRVAHQTESLGSLVPLEFIRYSNLYSSLEYLYNIIGTKKLPRKRKTGR